MQAGTPGFVLAALERNPLVAVVRLRAIDAALPLARALAAGGVGAIEFTLTSGGAYRAVEAVARAPEVEEGRLLLGAGTVLTADEARRAIAVGAQFIVSPVTDPETVAHCREAGIACMPGALTPTEVLAAWRLGATAVKLFPAGVMGPGYVKDLLAPLPALRLMVTGGINLETLGAYLRNGALAVGVGSSLVDPTQVANGEWEALTATASRYSRAIQAARG